MIGLRIKMLKCFLFVCFFIGRVIRYVKDYLVILLVDVRYANDFVKRIFYLFSKFLKWIKDYFIYFIKGYGDVYRLLY